jgi:DNA-binding CsgD family transcriptional regulator
MQSLVPNENLQSFRDRVVGAMTGQCGECDANGLWNSLAGGHSTIADAFYASDTSYLVVAPGNQRTPLSTRNRVALESALGGMSHKAVAIELRVSPSTLAIVLKEGLATLGLSILPSRIPLSLVALVHAALARDGACHRLRSTDLFAHGQHFEIVSVVLPRLSHVLSPAVNAVVSMRCEGKTHAEIAAQRRTSQRTVANQISIAFQRLSVSGRSDLLMHLTKEAGSVVFE